MGALAKGGTESMDARVVRARMLWPMDALVACHCQPTHPPTQPPIPFCKRFVMNRSCVSTLNKEPQEEARTKIKEQRNMSSLSTVAIHSFEQFLCAAALCMRTYDAVGAG